MLVIFVAAFAYGTTLHRADAGPCYCKCACSKPLRCCRNNGVETCKPATGFNCTQVFPCETPEPPWWRPFGSRSRRLMDSGVEAPRGAPCQTRSKTWERHVAAGTPGRVRLLGIGNGPLDLVRLYQKTSGLTFPIFADTAAVDQRACSVVEFPLRLEIDRARVIRVQTYDPDEESDPSQLGARLGG